MTRLQKPIKPSKANTMDLFQSSPSFFLSKMEEKKLKKINMRNIFKITIDQDVKPNWTEKQKQWYHIKGYNLPSLFSNSLKTISRIDNFK